MNGFAYFFLENERLTVVSLFIGSQLLYHHDDFLASFVDPTSLQLELIQLFGWQFIGCLLIKAFLYIPQLHLIY